jgi:antibiotic biosynthesis monooxygenase (ABM) superfamily enzyme
VLLGWLVAPHTAGWNLLLRVLLTTAVVVPYMAWVGVPAVSRWLHSWLHSDG